MEMEIPESHPWMEWLRQYADESMANGGSMRHGVLTVSVGGVEQRYDLVDVNMDGGRSVTFTARWRMFGKPEQQTGDRSRGGLR